MRWIKNNWKGLAILAGGLAAMAILVAVILSQREDRGFLVRQCVKTDPTRASLRWHGSSVPIPIRITEDSASWSAPLEDAFWWWKRHAGVVFRADRPLKPLEEAHDPVIIVEVISNGSFEPEHPGKTKLFWDETCRIRRAHVTVDGLVTDEKLRKVIMRHELGHALGLDHDTFEDSVMYPGGKPLRWGMDELTLLDRALLSRTYGVSATSTIGTSTSS